MPYRQPTPRRLRWATVIVAGAFTSLLTVPAAHAGSYVAWICKTPANVATSTAGWKDSSTLPGDVVLQNTCAAGGDGALSANFTRPAGSGTGTTGIGSGKWEFTAPAGTSISRARLQYGYGVVLNNSAADSYGESAVGLYRDGFVYDGNHILMKWQSKADGFKGQESGVFDVAINATRFGFDAGCYGPAGGQCGSSDLGRASMVLGWQQLFLTDDLAPRASSTGGSALDPGSKKGVETVKFDASDEGAGVYAAQATLDGTVVSPWAVIDRVNGQCEQVDLDPVVEREYRQAKPCPSATSAVVSFDTAKVADGDHLLTVQVADAAGNATVAVSKKITVANGTASGPTTPAPSVTPVGKAKLTFAISRSSVARRNLVRFSGSVVADQLPSKGLRVVLEAKDGKRWVTSALLRPKAKGKFAWSHRFRTRGRYQFRARLLGHPDLPKGLVVSKTRSLRVR